VYVFHDLSPPVIIDILKHLLNRSEMGFQLRFLQQKSLSKQYKFNSLQCKILQNYPLAKISLSRF